MELFVAIGLEKPSAEKLVGFTESALPEHPAEHPDDLHITLHYIGETGCVNEIAERLSEVCCPSFCIHYAQIDSFVRPGEETNVIWQAVDDQGNHLAKLRAVISEALSDVPFQRPDGFTPHITLSYTAQPFDAAELTRMASPLAGEAWEVREFQLWQVLPGTRKPSFRKIASYRLSAGRERGSVRLLCVNDFHGSLQETDADLGAARFVTAVREYVERHEETAVVFGGDNCFGEPVSDLFDGRPVLDMMKLLRTRASVLGNHDLDSPVDVVSGWSQRENIPLLAANLIHTETGELPGFVRPYEIVSINGYRIALVGLCTVEQLPGPDHPGSWAAYTLTDPAEAMARYGALLQEEKQSGRLDAVIALTHLGLRELGDGLLDGEEALDAIDKSPELDGIFTAHFHRFLQLTRGRTAVVQGGSRGQGFAVLKLTFDETRGLLSVVPLTYDVSGSHALYAEDPRMRAMTESYYRAAEPRMQEIVFTAEEDIQNRNMADFSLPLTGTPLSKLAADVMRQATGCQVAMTYAGRVGGAGFRKGPVTLYDFYKAYSFANILVTTRMTGAQIRENIKIGMRTLKEDGASPLAVGGLIVTIDPARPLLHRVLNIQEEDGSPLRADKEYSVVIEDYLAANPFGFRFPDGEALTYHNKNVRELMLQYFRSRKTIRNEYPTNIIVEKGR